MLRLGASPAPSKNRWNSPSSFIDISPDLIYNLQDTVVLPETVPTAAKWAGFVGSKPKKES